MVRLVTDYLDNSCKRFPQKVVFAEYNREITFEAFRLLSIKIASFLGKRNLNKKPIAIYLDKGIDVLAAFMGCAYSGNYYALLDSNAPKERAKSIVDNLEPEYIITNQKYVETVGDYFADTKFVLIEDLYEEIPDEELIKAMRNHIIDTDILYILYTSGSTGVPKGTIVSHKAVVAYIEWASEAFCIDHNEVLGNQTPFYFSMSVFDIYVTLRNACTMQIIPHKLFSLPDQLMKYLIQRKVNLLYWVPSALMIVANSSALDDNEATDLRKVLFAGEVMPTKQLNIWKRHFPNVMFANLYGPTETTDICTYYVVDREFDDSESLPIGYPCENADIIVLDEFDKPVTRSMTDVEGELCVRGSFLAYGYYKDEKKTNEVFVQNPLNHEYKEVIYRTGDLVKYNELGEIIYIGRKDFQIKVNGYRIELGEIETAISSVEEIQLSCCIFDDESKLLVCVYTGDIDKSAIRKQLKERLPRYMMPHKYIHLQEMPLNANGKIDRKRLKEII